MSSLAEFDLYGDVGGENGISAGKVRAFLRANKDAKDITVRIKSSGGDVLEGMSIYNLLSAHPAKITVCIDGLAASIASIVAMAADEIQICEGSFLMIHNPYAMTKGESDELRKTADVLDKMAKSMVDVYVDRTGKSREQIVKLMDAETWMSAKEAVAAGFADKIVKLEKKAEARYSLGAYAHVPQELLDSVIGEKMDEKKKVAELEAALAKMTEKCDKLEKDAKASADAKAEADAAATAQAKKVADDDGDDDDDDDDDEDDLPKDKKKAKKDEKKNPFAQAESNKVMTALADATKMIAQLKSQLEAGNKSKFEARVTEAVKEGKLLPSQKAWAMSLDETDFDAYIEALGDMKFPLGKEHVEDPKKTPAIGDDLTPEEKKLAAGMGTSEADLIAYNKSHPKAK